jgi:hypothetical protein
MTRSARPVESVSSHTHTIVALLAAMLATRVASAQPLASPRSTITQLVDSTTISVEYYRPSVRGRVVVGRLVPWGRMWTPGANWATTLDVDRDVRIASQPLPRGKYSLWMIPSPSAWTVVLSRQARRFHVVRPDAKEEQLRFTVRPDSGPHVEMLTFSFPDVSRVGATLRLQWERTVIAIPIEVEQSRSLVMPAHPRASYVGSYVLRQPGDTTSAGVRYEITDRDGLLRVRTTAAAVEPGLDSEFDLESIGGDEFHPRQYRNGILIGVEADEVIAFRVEGARATGFEVRAIAERRILARGTRTPP